MRVQYLPFHEIKEVVHINSICLERQYAGISTWQYGQIKDVPPELKFRVSYGDKYYVSLLEDLLSDNAFKIVDGKNPNFHCQKCGIETFNEFFVGPQGNPIQLEINGSRVCKPCFHNSE